MNSSKLAKKVIRAIELIPLQKEIEMALKKSEKPRLKVKKKQTKPKNKKVSLS